MSLAATNTMKDDSNLSSAATNARYYLIKREALLELNHSDTDVPNKKWRADGVPKTQDLKHKSDNTQTSNRYLENDALNGITKKVVDVSYKYKLPKAIRATERGLDETDAHRLSQRQKQIDYGRNTLGYEHYVKLVP
ncbi:hypothetical protein KI387_020024, partial [Taxus chinensis]